MSRVSGYSKRLLVLGVIALCATGGAQGWPTGIGGDADEKGEVPLAGCTCHNELSDNSVTVLID